MQVPSRNRASIDLVHDSAEVKNLPPADHKRSSGKKTGRMVDGTMRQHLVDGTMRQPVQNKLTVQNRCPKKLAMVEFA